MNNKTTPKNNVRNKTRRFFSGAFLHVGNNSSQAVFRRKNHLGPDKWWASYYCIHGYCFFNNGEITDGTHLYARTGAGNTYEEVFVSDVYGWTVKDLIKKLKRDSHTACFSTRKAAEKYASKIHD